MIVRQPKISFHDVVPHWCRTPELAQSLNAGSIAAPHVETFLNRTMAQASDLLDSNDEALKTDIKLFRKQEGNHLRIHLGFNKRFYEFGYGQVRALEQELEEDLKRFVNTKSLRFNLAYCVGFECFANYLSKYIFEGIPHLLEGADPSALELWRWHVAEEYEHRAVCHESYVRLFGAWWKLGYFFRVYGLVYSMIHLMGLNKRMIAAMLKQDREKMDYAEIQNSEARVRKLERTSTKFLIANMFSILVPGYNPRNDRPARGLREFLAAYDAGSAERLQT